MPSIGALADSPQRTVCEQGTDEHEVSVAKFIAKHAGDNYAYPRTLLSGQTIGRKIADPNAKVLWPGWTQKCRCLQEVYSNFSGKYRTDYAELLRETNHFI